MVIFKTDQHDSQSMFGFLQWQSQSSYLLHDYVWELFLQMCRLNSKAVPFTNISA